MTEASKTPNHIGQFWTGRASNLLEFRRVAELTVWPGFDMLLRVLLAQPFLTSGLIQLSNMGQAMFLAANEYPVSWASPAVATILGISVELGAGLLLSLALFTRLAGALLAAMAMVIQTVYQPLDLNLHWAVLGVWFLLAGAGLISVDALIRRGLSGAALSFAPQLSSLFD